MRILMRLLSLYLLGLALFTSCRASGPGPADLAPESVGLPNTLQPRAAWLTPPPAGSTPAQMRKWQAAQRRAMVQASKPAGKVKLKHVGNTKAKSDFTLKQREKLKQVDRSKQKNDYRNQAQKNADLRRKQKNPTKTGFTLPAGFWIAVIIVLLAWLCLRFVRGRV